MRAESGPINEALARQKAEALRPIDKVQGIAAPKLFIAGTEDRHTTIEESRRIFDAAREPKEFWAVEGAHHMDLHEFTKNEYERRLLEFFARHLRH